MLYRHIFLFTIGVLALALSRPTSIQAQDCSLVDVSRISVATNGTQANYNSDRPALSADGRYMVFASEATNLVEDDYNGTIIDIFLHDRQEGTTTRITATGDHAYTPAISADGQVVVFASANFYIDGDEYVNTYQDIISYNRQTATFTRISGASGGTLSNGSSYTPAISANGQMVAFSSEATNLVANDTNSYSDIFVRDLAAGTTTRVSVATGGAEASNQSYSPAISADGRYIAFTSYADNLVPNDNNPQHWDIFVHDRQTSETTRVSVASDGTQGNNYSGGRPAISADGHYVAFHSYASNLVPGDTNVKGDIFVRDWQTGITTRVSVASDGTQANGSSVDYVALSADGRYVVFSSYASNLVPGDANGKLDIFVHDRQTGITTRVSVARDGSQANSDAEFPAISGDGRWLAFRSGATNLVSGDTNSARDIFAVSYPLLVSPATAIPQRNNFWHSATLTWNPVSWATRYHIQVTTDKTFTTFKVNEINNDNIAPNILSLKVSNLDAGVTYYWRVKARKVDGTWSSWSPVETFTGC